MLDLRNSPYSLLFLSIDLCKPVVSHGSRQRHLWLRYLVHSGIHLLIVSVKMFVKVSKLSLQDSLFVTSLQSITENCFCRAFIFFGLVSLEVIITGSFLAETIDGIIQAVGKWSLISLMSTLLVNEPHRFWLTIMLSISVAELCVILVGMRPKSKLLCKNSFVTVCWLDFIGS